MGKKGRSRRPESPGSSRERQDRLRAPPPVADPFRADSPSTAAAHEAFRQPRAEEGATSGDRPAGVRDDASVPPVGDWDLPFFTEEYTGDAVFELEPDPWAERAAIFAATSERRAHLARYVIGAVALSGVICLVAALKVVIVGLGGSPGGTGVETTVQAAPVDDEPEPLQALAPLAEPPEPSTLEDAPVADAAPSEPVSKPPEVGLTAKASDTDDPSLAAPKERENCRAALERNRLTAAVEACEHAVQLDPTDGETWLILGAAYQQRGDAANARRCYRACLDEGRRGPRNACAQMLR